MDSWQKVYSCPQEHRAGMVHLLLEEMNFKPVLVNKRDTIYQIGYYEVYVAPKFVLRAIKILEDEISFE
jgi:hypothetical protein